MKLNAEHYREIDDAMTDIKAIHTTGGATRATLEAMQDRLVRLARRTDLFNTGALPAPKLDERATNYMYRLYEEEGGLALYANVASGRFFETPVHNHKTWAVLAGVEGSEMNRLFERTDDDGIRETGQESLCQGTSLGFDGEDLHAIRIEAPLLNFHLYGVGLEQQKGRQLYDPDKQEWVYFEAHPDIVEAREGRAAR